MRNNYFSKTKIANVFEKPSNSSNLSSQIIYGEKFKILSKSNNFYKVKNLYDNYIGFIDKKIIKVHEFEPTHKIKVLKSRIYIGLKNKKKTPLSKWLPFGSKIQIIEKDKNFIMFEKEKWLKLSEVSALVNKDKNFINIFKLFINCPYKWGGKTYEGIDCSALIQIYYKYNNIFFPRDTIDQIKQKKNLKIKRKFRKGDIIFWKGHVAVCIDSKNLIHAYGPMKKVIMMPIKKTIQRIEKTANLKVKKVFCI